MSTRNVMADAGKYAAAVEKQYLSYFKALLHNSLLVENLPDDVPKRYFLKELFQHGRIGYADGLYLPVYGVGIDIYGLPLQYVFHGYNGVVFTKDAKDCVILRINDQSTPLYPFLELRSKQIAEIETSIHQNLFAVRTQTVYECADNASLLSLENAFKARKLGAEVIFQTSSFTGENKVSVQPTGAEYICDQLNTLKESYITDVLKRIGIMTATDKAERVQTAEVNANVGIAYENIYSIIDTFNYDAEVGGLDIRLKTNGTIDNYFEDVNASKEDDDNDELF